MSSASKKNSKPAKTNRRWKLFEYASRFLARADQERGWFALRLGILVLFIGAITQFVWWRWGLGSLLLVSGVLVEGVRQELTADMYPRSPVYKSWR